MDLGYNELRDQVLFSSHVSPKNPFASVSVSVQTSTGIAQAINRVSTARLDEKIVFSSMLIVQSVKNCLV